MVLNLPSSMNMAEQLVDQTVAGGRHNVTSGRMWPARIFKMGWGDLERETGIEPAINGLGSRYSTIELLPLQPELYLKVQALLETARRCPFAR